MAKLTAPLFSLKASGTIGEALTYASWRGIEYVRTRVIPQNPQSAAQTAVREVFKTLNNLWNRAPTYMRAPWAANAAGKAYTDRNKFVSRNVPLLQGDANCADFEFSQQSNGALAPLTVAASNGVGNSVVTITAPTPPVGWTLVAAVAAAFPDGDPNPAIAPTPIAGRDTSDPYAITLTPLTTVLHRVGGWLEWLDPDGVTRYSDALKATCTPT